MTWLAAGRRAGSRERAWELQGAYFSGAAATWRPRSALVGTGPFELVCRFDAAQCSAGPQKYELRRMGTAADQPPSSPTNRPPPRPPLLPATSHTASVLSCKFVHCFTGTPGEPEQCQSSRAGLRSCRLVVGGPAPGGAGAGAPRRCVCGGTAYTSAMVTSTSTPATIAEESRAVKRVFRTRAACVWRQTKPDRFHRGAPGLFPTTHQAQSRCW